MARKKPKKDDPLVTFAVIDETGLLIRFEKGRRSAGLPDCIEVPDGCDLSPGRYRWNAPGGRFDPLPPNEPLSGPPTPDALRAIWLAFRSLAEAGHEFPPETRAWIEAYGKTIDAKGERQ